ncbi:MAG TPA: hypothetical protein PK890_04385 [Terrimesophilobacter sp.]|nr:hypothetical protein [Terrimesophilobacter sp.]
MTDSPAETAHDDSEVPAKAPTDRTLLVVLVVIAVLVVAALVAVFARGASPQYEADSPEGVVQRYVTAVMAGDFESARELHVSRHTGGCSPVPAYVSSDARVTLIDTSATFDSTIVTVRISEGYGGPFGGDSGYEDRFELMPVNGKLLVSYAPWMFQVCIDQEVKG